MPIIKIPQMLRPMAQGRPIWQCAGATVGQCIDDLLSEYPGMEGELLDSKGRLLPRWHLIINKKVIHSKEMEALVQPDDQIDLIQAVSGG